MITDLDSRLVQAATIFFSYKGTMGWAGWAPGTRWDDLNDEEKGIACDDARDLLEALADAGVFDDD